MKLFVDGEVQKTTKNNLVCNVPDVENNYLECLQDTLAVATGNEKTSTPEFSRYYYLKIGRSLNPKPEKLLLDDLKNGSTAEFEFGSLEIKKTNNGTTLQSDGGDSEWLSCN